MGKQSPSIMARADGRKQEKRFDFRKVGAIIQKNFIVLMRDKTRLVPLLLFPVFMIIIFGFTSGSIPKHISTAIIVQDSSPLSQEFQQAVADNQIFTVRHVVSTEGEGKHLLDSGEVQVLIEIPPDFDRSVAAGQQAAVTIIVDESDSAVASTATQTATVLVSEFSARVSQEKLLQIQRTIGSSGEQLQQYIGAQPDTYGLILTNTAAAQALLAQSKQLTDKGAANLLHSVPPPSLIVLDSGPGSDTFLTGNTTYVARAVSEPGTKAQAGILLTSSDLVGAAAKHVDAATNTAAAAEAQVSALQDPLAYERSVNQPLTQIRLFSQVPAQNLLRPVVSEQKPAYGTGKRPVDFLIPAIIAVIIFQGAVMGMGRAVAGEKREGSLTRVFLTPTSNATIIFGTLLFYVFFELLRSSFIIGIAVLLFNIQIEGSFLLIALILVIYTSIATSVGMVLSSMAKTEGQYMALAMLVSMPTLFLGGAFFPLEAMPHALQTLASLLPVTYAGAALRSVMVKGFSITLILVPLFTLLAFLAVMLTAVFVTFKRDIE